jgi:hypothetical protein
MRWLYLFFATILVASCQTASTLDTATGNYFYKTKPWPKYQSALQPGPSESAFKAPDLSDVDIQPAASDIDSAKASYLGHWKGYLCSTNRSYDVQIAVTSVTNEGADFVYSVASSQDGLKPEKHPMNGRFADGSLNRALTKGGTGAGINMRLRDDGHMDVQWVHPSNGNKCFGVLQRASEFQNTASADRIPLESGPQLATEANSNSIHLLAALPERISRDLAKQTDKTIESEIGRLNSEYERNYITSNERHHTTLFVFRQPLKPGTRIRTEHQFTRPGMGRLTPFQFYYTVSEESATEPFIIVNRTNAGGRGGTITYRAYVNRKKVAETVVKIS